MHGCDLDHIQRLYGRYVCASVSLVFSYSGRFLVSTDVGAVEERHPKLHALLLGQRQ